jgi:hypothetical protein
LRSIRLELALDTVVDKIPVRDYKAYYPKDIHYPIMMAFKPCGNESAILDEIKKELNLSDATTNPALAHMSNPEGVVHSIQSLFLNFSDYKPMKKSNNPFLPAKGDNGCKPGQFFGNPSNCVYEYIKDSNGLVTTTEKYGVILVAGKAYARDKITKSFLIPDDEVLKRAIVQYCLYMYMESRIAKADAASLPGLINKSERYLRNFQALKLSARTIDLPDIDSLENIGQAQHRLKDPKNMHDKFFEGLGFKENIKY